LAQADEKEAASDGVDDEWPVLPPPPALVRQDALTPAFVFVPERQPARPVRPPLVRPLPEVALPPAAAPPAPPLPQPVAPVAGPPPMPAPQPQQPPLGPLPAVIPVAAPPPPPAPQPPLGPPPAAPPLPPHLNIPAARGMPGRAAVIQAPNHPQLAVVPDVQDYLLANPACSVANVSILYRETDAEQSRNCLRALADIFTVEARVSVTDSLAVTPYRFLPGDLSLDSEELHRCPAKRTFLGYTVWTDSAPSSATAVWLNATYAYHRHQWIIVPLARHLLRQRSTLMRKVYDTGGKTLDSVFQNLRQLATADDTPPYWRTHLPMWEATLAYVANQVCILGARTRVQHTESGVPVFRLR